MGILRVIQVLSLVGGIVAGACILLITGLILVEIFIRSSTGISILIAEEYSAYLLVVFGSMALAYTLRAEGHIRVNLILSRLSQGPKNIINLFCSAIGFLTFFIVSFHTWKLLYESWNINETSMHYSKTPLYLPQIPLFLGSCLMSLEFLYMLLNNFQNFLKDRGKEPIGKTVK